MKYSIIICPKSKNSIAIGQAYQFIESILQSPQVKQAHTIDVFFYGLAVKSAFHDLYDWRTMARQGVKLTACSTIAESYKSDKSNKSNKQACSYFTIAGIGQWMESTLDADKNIEFI
ncbi:MAG: DsrE family protein [Proteobacteria bacterium]|nr:DsrE family protein [Pseudomonadota bacterium]